MSPTFDVYPRCPATAPASGARCELIEGHDGAHTNPPSVWLPEAEVTPRCPTCDSPQPHLHPAVQHEGEVEVCKDKWHESTQQGREVLKLSDRRAPVEPPAREPRLQLMMLPNPILRTRCPAFAGDDANADSLVSNMIATMRKFHGIGLAAPQVGIATRLAIVELPEASTIVLRNAEIVSPEGEQIGDEGCLSIPGVVLPITRAQKIRVKSEGWEAEREFEGLAARAIQHELDHLDGILITDRLVSSVASLRAQLAQAEDDQKLLKWVYGKCRAYPQHTGAEPDVTMYGMMHRVFYKASCADTYQRIALEQQEKVKVAEAALAQAQQEHLLFKTQIQEALGIADTPTQRWFGCGVIECARNTKSKLSQTEAALRIAISADCETETCEDGTCEECQSEFKHLLSKAAAQEPK